MVAARPLADTLAAVPFFAGLDAAGSIASLGGCGHAGSDGARSSSTLGDPGDALFIVMSGEIKITLPSDTGDEAILATLRRRRRLRRARAARRSAALGDRGRPRADRDAVLPRDQFRELIATEPAIRDALLASLAGELRRLTNHVEELHFLDITGRLASRLVAARGARPAGRTTDGSIRLRAPLTQGDLAAMVGCTRQSVNKLLGLFTDDGLIRLDRDGIVVIDLDGLTATARRCSPAVRSRGAGRAARSPRRVPRAGVPRPPPRNARRRSRWVRSGSTTTTVTAVSSPRARPGHATPTSLPPTSRPLPASASSPSVEPACGVVAAMPDMAGASASGWWAAAGASGASVSARRSHGTSPSSPAKLPPVPTSTTAAVQPRSASAAPIASRPGGLALGPDVLLEEPRTRSAAASTRSAAAAAHLRAEIRTSTASARAYVATIGFGRPEQLLAEQVRDRRLADPRQPERPAAMSAPAPLAEAGQDVPAHIGRISRGGPGSATTTRPSGAVDPPAGAVPLSFGRAAADGISQACLRFISGMAIPRRAQSSRSHASRPGSTTGVSPATSAIASRVRSSGVGPRPPVETTRSARVEPLPRTRRVTAARSSGSAGSGRPRRRSRQTPGQLAGVRVARLADRQLRADAQQLGGQERSRGGHRSETSARDGAEP